MFGGVGDRPRGKRPSLIEALGTESFASRRMAKRARAGPAVLLFPAHSTVILNAAKNLAVTHRAALRFFAVLRMTKEGPGVSL